MEPVPSRSTRRRPVAAGLFAIGLVHVLAPGRLLRGAGVLYDRLLEVEFSPRKDAPRRVRFVGVLMCLAGELAWNE
jgi:hypothetical protein